MPLAIAFWVIWFIALVMSTWLWWPMTRERGPFWLIWVLLFLLGWGVFGFPVKG